MLKFPFGSATAPSVAWQHIPFLMAFLGFIPNFAFATLRGLFSTCQPTPTPEQITQDWPYGLAVVLGIAFLITAAFFRFQREPTTRNGARFVLRTFASVSFLTIVGLVAIRVWHERSPKGFVDYLTGARYLIPGTIVLTGLISELLFFFSSAPVILNVILQAGLAGCAIMGNLQYAAYVYPKVFPRAMISHAHAWQSVVTMAKECQRADLPIPNLPLGGLVEFETWDLKLFEPLLRADLALPPGKNLQFVEWLDFVKNSPDEYDRDVPSLSEVQKKLRLERQKSSH